MDAESLEGHWRLESFYVEQADGQRMYPFGPDPVGYLTYWQGRFQANLMASGRQPFASGDLANPAPDEAVAAFRQYIGYTGRYDFDGRQVSHMVEVASFPDWVGGTQTRLVAWQDNRLVLTTPPLAYSGATPVFTLVWRRA
jgi:hypothetical protein